MRLARRSKYYIRRTKLMDKKKISEDFELSNYVLVRHGSSKILFSAKTKNLIKSKIVDTYDFSSFKEWKTNTKKAIFRNCLNVTKNKFIR